jgi:hypothetical protein
MVALLENLLGRFGWWRAYPGGEWHRSRPSMTRLELLRAVVGKR